MSNSTTTAPAALTIVTGKTRNYSTRTDEISTATVQVGDFLSETLVTDTLVYEVVKVTAKTVTVRYAFGTGVEHVDTSCDVGGHGTRVVWEEQESNENAELRTLRVRKDGTIRSGSHAGARPFRPAKMIDGKPVRRIDYRA